MRRSTPITWSELKVGVLVTVGIALLVIAIVTLGGRLGVFEETYTLYTAMPSVSGLQSGAPVRLAGVNVGTVDEVRFIESADRDSLQQRMLRAYGDSLGERAVVVRFQVNRGVQEKVTRSSRAKTGTVGLLGDKYLDVEVGDPRDPTLEEGDLVLNERPIDYEGLIARAAEGVEELVSSLEGSREIIAKVNRGEGTLGRLINRPELYQEWLRISREGTNMLQQMQTGEGTLPALLNDRTLYIQLVEATADLERLTTRIEDGEGTLGRLVQDPDLYQDLVETVREGQRLIRELQTGDGTLARMINDPALYERLNGFVVDAQGLINDMEQNPRKYINLKIF
ncbi:MAG: MlaD family protein [Gemmatimonadota bacterium]|nr:MlaD family protein [Gemmatimonadota bacterium]